MRKYIESYYWKVKKKRAYLDKYFKYVVKKEKHSDWKMKWTRENRGFCDLDEQLITIPNWLTSRSGEVENGKLYILHEIAHISTLERDYGHGQIFFKEYYKLIRRYLLQNVYNIIGGKG